MPTHTVSYSELDTFRQCPFKHELSYKQRWTSPETSPALAKGTLWHAVMEHHYKALLYWQVTNNGNPTDFEMRELKREIVGQYLADDGGQQTEYQALIEWMYQGYVDHWGSDREWKILAVEHAPTIWLPTDRGGRSNFKLKLKIDLVVAHRTNGNMYVVDHKSGKDLPKDKELEIDDQFGLYTWAMRQMGRKVFGSIHNAARTQRNKDQIAHFQPLDERFARKPMYRTDAELDTLVVEAYRAARRAYSIKPGEADRAPDPDRCRWRCNYTEQCLGSRKGMDLHDLLVSSGFVQDFTRH